MRLRKAIQVVRDAYPDMPMQTLYVFLTVSEMGPGPVRQTDLLNATGMTGGSLSRNISILDEWAWTRRPGLKLVSTQVDLMDRRQRLISLTRKGKALLKAITEAMNEGDT